VKGWLACWMGLNSRELHHCVVKENDDRAVVTNVTSRYRGNSKLFSPTATGYVTSPGRAQTAVLK
jgi:hypothetical protein